MVGIIGAMEVEIKKIVENLENKTFKKIEFLDFYLGSIAGSEVVVVKSSEGKVNSAVATQILISNFNVDYVINVGIAGAVDNSLKIYDIVIATKTAEFDIDVTALGYKKGFAFGIDTVFVDTYEKVYSKLNNICNKLGFNANLGIVVSSDEFVADVIKKKELKESFNALAVDMESASINHVSRLNNIPFISLRIISDTGNNVEYREFENKALNNIFNILKEYFKEVNI